MKQNMQNCSQYSTTREKKYQYTPLKALSDLLRGGVANRLLFVFVFQACIGMGQRQYLTK